MNYVDMQCVEEGSGRRGEQRGFTLIELLAVITLISLIALVVGKSISSQSEGAVAKLNVQKMEKMKQSLSQYRLDFGSYPSSLRSLIEPSSEVVSSGKLFIKYADEDDLKDMWKNAYRYQLEGNGRSYSLSSLGADAAEGGAGPDQDITIRP